MPFSATSKKSGKIFFLHAKPTGKTTLYYFAGTANPERALDAVPEGMEVAENSRTGLPYLKRKP